MNIVFDNMPNGSGTIELLERLDEIDNTRSIVETNAHGSDKLVWVKIGVTSFFRDGSGYSFKERGRDSYAWVHEANVRNFERCNS